MARKLKKARAFMLLMLKKLASSMSTSTGEPSSLRP
jgi:hypothetical protein